MVVIVLLMTTCSATILPLNTFETQGISTSSVVAADGRMSHHTSLEWALSSEYLGFNAIIVNPFFPPVIVPEPPLNPLGEVQMYCSYHEDTLAQDGILDYRRSGSVETGPRLTGSYNVVNDRMITYISNYGGRLYSTEDLMLDNIGNALPILALSCPFAQNVAPCTPSFCNRVEAGSVIDMTLVSAVTSADLHTVTTGNPGFWPPVPSADEPAELSYHIRVTGINPPAQGLVSAYSAAQTREGGSICPGDGMAHESSFRENVRVDGRVDLFDYIINYESGLRR